MASSSSKPQKVDFKIKQGDTFRRVFQFFEDPEQTVPLDVSTATFKFIIDGEADLELGSGLTIQGTDSNEVLLSVDVAWYGTKKYEFERVMAGITWTPFEGSIKSEIELDEDE
jgi:hypothetical protein